MFRLTKTLPLITALLPSTVYDTASASPAPNTTSTGTPIVQPIDINDENRRVMMDARIAMGMELKRK